ncbi:hypothetical protein J6G99_01070 [bacterium]|nr:hypothetical protein [bacterium]
MESIEINEFKELSCGANTQQSAWIAPLNNSVNYEILSRNKELEYIDFINLSENIKILGEFFDVNCAVITNEATVCAVSLGSTIANAFEKASDCDPMSIKNSTVGFSKEITLEVSKLLKSMNVKNILAPAFSKEAFSYLLETNIKIIKINSPVHEILGFDEKDIKITPFGTLIQEQNKSKLSKEAFNVVTQIKPAQEQAEDAIFAWKVSKHLKSRSAVIVKDLCTKAIVQGKANNTIAVESAMDNACENSKDAVLALDGAIEGAEVINAAIQGRIALIIEAGDSPKSQDILKLADKYGLSMIFTKIRNNRY